MDTSRKTYRIRKPLKPLSPLKEDLLESKTDTPIKVFISYAHAQTQVVEEIIKGLEKRGHTVWFDKTNITHGDDWRKEITDGITSSNGVLSFLSREAIRDGGVCLDELGIAVGVKYGNIRTVLLHREKDLQPLPAQLTHRQWLDMSDWESKAAEGPECFRQWLQEKLTIIIRMIESPESREFEGEISLIRKKLDIEDTAISRQGWYLQQPFVGRQWLTEKLEAWLDDPNGGHLCAVYGGPGTGKSAFAAQYVYHSPRVAASLFFEHGNTYFNSSEAIVRELVFQLACRLPGYRSLLISRLNSLPDTHHLNIQEIFEQLLASPLRHVINGGHDTLCVVIDGLDECAADSQRLAAELLSREHFPAWLRVVVLTRPENTVTAHLNPDLVISMTEDQAANRADIRAYIELRLAALPEGRQDRDVLLERLTENADGVFLYATIVTDMILNRMLDLADPDAYPQGLNASFEKWFFRYFPDPEAFDRLYKLPLGIIAACPEPIPVEELNAIRGRYDREEGCFHLEKQEEGVRRESIVKQLEKCALLLKYGKDDFGETTVSFTHRYITEWLTRTDAASGQSASREYYCDPADACWAMETAWRSRLTQGQPLTGYQALHLLDCMKRAGEPEETIRETAGNDNLGNILEEKRKLFDQAGKWKQCLPFAQAQLDRYIYAYGQEHHDTLTAMNNLAYTYAALGRHQDALCLQEQALALWKHILGDEHPDMLTAMAGFAYTYGALGRHQDALRLKEQVLALSKRILGDEHPATLTAMNNLALTYGDLGRHQDALRLQEQVFALRKRILGDEHPDTLSSLQSLSYTYYQLGQYEKCISMDTLAVTITEKLYGTESKEMATALNNLSMAYSKLERYADALPLMERAYSLYRELLGEDNPKTIRSRDRVQQFREKLQQA